MSMKSNKIIITKDEKIPDVMAMFYVQQVIEGGLVSKNSYGKHYCWVVAFKDGVRVITRERRYKNSKTHSFHVEKYKP